MAQATAVVKYKTSSGTTTTTMIVNDKTEKAVSDALKKKHPKGDFTILKIEWKK